MRSGFDQTQVAKESEENGEQNGQEERQGEVGKLSHEPGKAPNDKDCGDQLIEPSESQFPTPDQTWNPSTFSHG